MFDGMVTGLCTLILILLGVVVLHMGWTGYLSWRIGCLEQQSGFRRLPKRR